MNRKKENTMNAFYSNEDKKFINSMCKNNCKFYIDDKCSKKRLVRNCAKYGLKNREESAADDK